MRQSNQAFVSTTATSDVMRGPFRHFLEACLCEKLVVIKPRGIAGGGGPHFLERLLIDARPRFRDADVRRSRRSARTAPRSKEPSPPLFAGEAKDRRNAAERFHLRSEHTMNKPLESTWAHVLQQRLAHVPNFLLSSKR